MRTPLPVVKFVHTAVWVFFASCILTIPFYVWANRLDVALALIGIVALEVFVLAFNAWRCPLTDVAARYTSDRSDNFDIYLPVWIARHNKAIFGTLYAAGVVWTVTRWMQ